MRDQGSRVDNLVERLRVWADYAEKRFAAPSGNAMFVGLSDHKIVREAADRIEALGRELAEVECERDHAYWESCGCLAGNGGGHRPGMAGYPCCENALTVRSETYRTTEGKK